VVEAQAESINANATPGNVAEANVFIATSSRDDQDERHDTRRMCVTAARRAERLPTPSPRDAAD
jgi:hypothetical protein